MVYIVRNYTIYYDNVAACTRKIANFFQSHSQSILAADKTTIYKFNYIRVTRPFHGNVRYILNNFQ